MPSRFNRRRSNLQDMNRLSTSCPVVDSPRLVSAEDSDSDSTESSDFEDRAATGIQQHWAQQSVRRDREKNLAHQRNMEQNKISMDDYFGKQAEFRIWLMEEQKKQYADLSSPKRRTYFKMFMRMWNKRSLPVKYFECRISKHVEDSASSPEFCEPHERILQLRPQDLNLFPRSPILDPSIFPHCVDLSDDSFSASTSSPFSTFGKSAATSLNFKPSFTSPLTRESKKNSDTNVKEGTYETKNSSSGSNKENAVTRFSHHVTAASRAPLRTAVISPSHKLLINSPYRGSKQQEVMTRKKPQLTPVNSPKCPADQHLTGKYAGTCSRSSSNLNANTQHRLMRFQETRNFHHLYGACEQTGTIGEGKPQIAPTSHYEALLGSSPHQALMNIGQGHYQEVKDSVSPAYSSPAYAEPFLIVPDSSDLTAEDLEEKRLKVKELKVTDKQKSHSGKTNRRRSRSLDETSVYALPLKNGLKEGLHPHWTVSEENLQTSPPPLPPRLYNTKEVSWSSDASNTIPGLKPSDHINLTDTPLTTKSSSKKRFLQFLWSTKSEHVNKPHSLKVESEKKHCIFTEDQEKRDCESFPLVKMDKSPVLGRRNMVACHEAKATGRTIKVLTSNTCEGNSHSRATIKSDGCFEDNVSQACSLSKAQNCISPSNRSKLDERITQRRDSPDKMSVPQVSGVKTLSKSSSRRRSKSMEDISCSLKEAAKVNFAWSVVPQHLKQRENPKLFDSPQKQMSSDENKDTASICARDKLQRTNILQDKDQMPQRKIHVSLHEEQDVSERLRTVPHVISMLQTADGRLSHTQGKDDIMGKLEETKSSSNELGTLKEFAQLDSSPKRLGQVKKSSSQAEMEFDEPSEQMKYLPRDASVMHHNARLVQSVHSSSRHASPVLHTNKPAVGTSMHCISTPHTSSMPPDPSLYVTGIPAEPSLNSISRLHTSSIPADPSLHAIIIPTESLLQSFDRQHSNMPSDPIQFTTTTLASPTKGTAVKAGLAAKARSVDISLHTNIRYTEPVEKATTTMSSDLLLTNTTSSDSIGLGGSTDNAALGITSMCDQLSLTSPISSEVNSPSSLLLKNSGPDLLLARLPDPVFTHPRTPEPALSTGTKLGDPQRLTSAIGQPLHSSPVKGTFSTWNSSVISKTVSAVKTEITASGQAATVSSLEGIRQAKEDIPFCQAASHAFCSTDTHFLKPSSHQVGQGNHLEGPPVIQKQINMLKETGPKFNSVWYPGSFSSIEQSTSAISNSAIAVSNSTIQLSTLSKCHQTNRRRSRSVGDLATVQIETTSGCQGTQGEACQESVPSFSSLKSFWSKQNQTQVKSNKPRLPHSPSPLLTAPSFLSHEVPAGVLSRSTADDQKTMSSCINHHDSQIAAERQARAPLFTRQSSCSEMASFSEAVFTSAASLSLKAPVDNVNNSKGGGGISRETPPTSNQPGSTSTSAVSSCQNSCLKWNFSLSPSKKAVDMFHDGNFLHEVYPDSHHALRPTDLVTNPGPECSSPKHISASLERATDRAVHTFPLGTSPSHMKHEMPPILSAPSASLALCFSTLCQQTACAEGTPALSGQLPASVQGKTAFSMNGYKSPSKISSNHRLPSSVPKSDSPGKTSISRHEGTISLPQEPPTPDDGLVNPSPLSSKLSVSLGMTPSFQQNPDSSEKNMGFLAQMGPSLHEVPVTPEGDCNGRLRMSSSLTSSPSYLKTNSLPSSIDISEQSQGKAGSSEQGCNNAAKIPSVPFSPLLTHPYFHKDDFSEMTPSLLEVSLQNTSPFSDFVCRSPSKVPSSLSLPFLPETSDGIFSFRKTLSPSIQQNAVSVRDVPESEKVRSTLEKVFGCEEQMVSRPNQETPTVSKNERVMSGHSQETPTDGRREQTVPEHGQETPNNDKREHVRETTGDGATLPVQRSPFITTRRSSTPRNKQVPCWEDRKESVSPNPNTFGAGNFFDSGTNVSQSSGLPTTPKTRSATLSSTVNAAQTVEQTIHRTGKRQEKGSIFCSSLQFSPGAKPSPPPKPPKPLASYQTRKPAGAHSVSNFAFKATFQTVTGQGHSRGRCGQPVTPIRGQQRQSQEQNTREDMRKDEQKVGMLVEQEGANSSGMSIRDNFQWPRVQQLASGQTVSIAPSKRRSSGRTAVPSVLGRCSSSRLAEGSSSARRRSSGRIAKTPAATPQEGKAGAELEEGSKASRRENACVVPELVVYHCSPGARLAETRRRSNGRQGVTKVGSFRDSPEVMRVTSQTKRRSSGAHATDVRRSGSLARRRSSGRQDAALVATSRGGTPLRTVKKRSSGRVSTAGTPSAARRRSGFACGGLGAGVGLKSFGIANSGPGGAASKGKSRGNPRQSPTFIRIMRRLHTDEFDNSDDEDSNDDTKRSGETAISDNLSLEGNGMGSKCQEANLPLDDVQFATASAPYKTGCPTDEVLLETDIDAVADETVFSNDGRVETVSSRMVTMV
ncbi:mucin-12-like isoform X4 [Pomacea canaliculata]|uniref:mucin-12-like isoform X4 n=1 Tax=Pomacea canaliculata TaxID=400727 RepID=UPI000D73CF24|nr:mucin-12-like isoform X4 [Pomacea canaliculata]